MAPVEYAHLTGPVASNGRALTSRPGDHFAVGEAWWTKTA